MREQVQLHNYNINSKIVYVNERLRGAMNNKANKNKYSSKIKSNPSLKSMDSNINNISQSLDNQNNITLNPNNGRLRTVSFPSENTSISKHSNSSETVNKNKILMSTHD